MSISVFSVAFAFAVTAVAAVTLADDQCVDISVSNESGYILEVGFPDLAAVATTEPDFVTSCGVVTLDNNLAFGQTSQFRLPINTTVVLRATAGGEKDYIAKQNADYVCRGTTLTFECSETPQQ